MADFDVFVDNLLEESKRFLEKAIESDDSVSRSANLHASLMIGFCAFEARINSISQECSNRIGVSPHEAGVLLEKEVRLEGGVFSVKEAMKMTRLEERVEFLYVRFSGKPLDKEGSAWWKHLTSAIRLRNELTHPKAIPAISENSVRNALQAIIETLDAVTKATYKKSLPAASKGLKSRMQF